MKLSSAAFLGVAFALIVPVLAITRDDTDLAIRSSDATTFGDFNNGAATNQRRRPINKAMLTREEDPMNQSLEPSIDSRNEDHRVRELHQEMTKRATEVRNHPWIVICDGPAYQHECYTRAGIVCDSLGFLRRTIDSLDGLQDFMHPCTDHCRCFNLDNAQWAARAWIITPISPTDANKPGLKREIKGPILQARAEDDYRITQSTSEHRRVRHDRSFGRGNRRNRARIRY